MLREENATVLPFRDSATAQADRRRRVDEHARAVRSRTPPTRSTTSSRSRASPARGAAQLPDLARRPAGGRGGLMLVVIVTDNGFAAEAIRRSFRNTSGVRVAGYVDGRRACGAAVAEAEPDVVIVDEMTWSATARRPHRRGPRRGAVGQDRRPHLAARSRLGRRRRPRRRPRRDRQDGAAEHARPARARDLGRHGPSRLRRRRAAGERSTREHGNAHPARARDPPARRRRRLERRASPASSGSPSRRSSSTSRTSTESSASRTARRRATTRTSTGSSSPSHRPGRRRRAARSAPPREPLNRSSTLTRKANPSMTERIPRRADELDGPTSGRAVPTPHQARREARN